MWEEVIDLGVDVSKATTSAFEYSELLEQSGTIGTVD